MSWLGVFVPGLKEALRINGRTEISTDRELLAPLAIKDRLPLSVLKVTVDEAILHCAKVPGSRPAAGS